MLLRRDSALGEELAKEPAGRHADLEVAVGKPHAPKRIHRSAYHLGLGHDRLLADYVDVPLVVLAAAALRSALVAEALRHRSPFQREGKLLLALGDHARQRRSHLGAKREMTF